MEARKQIWVASFLNDLLDCLLSLFKEKMVSFWSSLFCSGSSTPGASVGLGLLVILGSVLSSCKHGAWVILLEGYHMPLE